MPYHIKTISSVINPQDVYYVDEYHWTETYDDRKVFSTEADALEAKSKTVTINDYTYVPTKLAGSTIISE